MYRCNSHDAVEAYIDTLERGIIGAVRLSELNGFNLGDIAQDFEPKGYTAWCCEQVEAERAGVAISGFRSRRNACLDLCRKSDNLGNLYEAIRTVNPHQFSTMWEENLAFGTPFDSIVARLCR